MTYQVDNQSEFPERQTEPCLRENLIKETVTSFANGDCYWQLKPTNSLYHQQLSVAESSERPEKLILRTRTKHTWWKNVKYCKPFWGEISKCLPSGHVGMRPRKQWRQPPRLHAWTSVVWGLVVFLGLPTNPFFFKPPGAPKGVL